MLTVGAGLRSDWVELWDSQLLLEYWGIGVGKHHSCCLFLLLIQHLLLFSSYTKASVHRWCWKFQRGTGRRSGLMHLVCLVSSFLFFPTLPAFPHTHSESSAVSFRAALCTHRVLESIRRPSLRQAWEPSVITQTSPTLLGISSSCIQILGYEVCLL